MTLEDMRLAIISRVATFTDAPLAFDNLPTPTAVTDAQQAGEPWIRVSILDGDGILRNLADDVARTGLVAVQVFTAQSVGERPARVLASSLCAHLEHYRSGGLRLRQANPSRVGQSDGYYQININIPFVAD